MVLMAQAVVMPLPSALSIVSLNPEWDNILCDPQTSVRSVICVHFTYNVCIVPRTQDMLINAVLKKLRKSLLIYYCLGSAVTLPLRDFCA